MSQRRLISTASGVNLARKLAAEGYRTFTIDQARKFAPLVGIDDGYLRQALHHLARAGWVVRLRRGLYVLSAATPGVTAAHEFEIAMALTSPAAIGYRSALHYHGLTEQSPRKVYVLTTIEAAVPYTRGAGERGFVVDGVRYQFIQVKPERFFGVQKVWVNEARIAITDPERTLLDGLSRPEYCGDFAEVMHAFEVRGKELKLARIIGYALRLDASIAKRLGWVLERQGISMGRLELLADVPVKGYRTLDPTGPRRGPCDRRWMIQENLPGKMRL